MITNATNRPISGLILRRNHVKNSQEYEIEGPLLENVFSLDVHLNQGVILYFKFYRRSNNSFIVLSGEETPYKLQLLDVTFRACKTITDLSIILSHMKEMEKKTGPQCD